MVVIVSHHGHKRGAMTSGTSHLWITTGDGELIRSDVITGLPCRDGPVEADRADGSPIRLAGPGCPNDCHLQLLRELAHPILARDDRWAVIISPQITAQSAAWVTTRLDELLGSDFTHHSR